MPEAQRPDNISSHLVHRQIKKDAVPSVLQAWGLMWKRCRKVKAGWTDFFCSELEGHTMTKSTPMLPKWSGTSCLGVKATRTQPFAGLAQGITFPILAPLD